MATIVQPTLAVDRRDAASANHRVVRVDYQLEIDPDDPVVGKQVSERIVVHAIDLHDAAGRPDPAPVLRIERTFVARPGRHHRGALETIARITLDVEGDWWASSLDGEPIPIAEWADHLVADIIVQAGENSLAAATTPIVTGSWGVLGRD